jgi:CHAD domain-containing protein
VALGALAPELVRPLVRALVRAGRRIDDRSPPEALHRVRVRAKRLRYALETLSGLGGRRLARVLRRLERLQELLGDYQDAVTQAAWLRRWSEEARVPRLTLLATGALIDRLGRRARRRRARFARAWRRLDRPRLRRVLSRGKPERPALRLVRRSA